MHTIGIKSSSASAISSMRLKSRNERYITVGSRSSNRWKPISMSLMRERPSMPND